MDGASVTALIEERDGLETSLVFADIAHLIAGHLDRRGVCIDVETRALLARLRDVAEARAERPVTPRRVGS